MLLKEIPFLHCVSGSFWRKKVGVRPCKLANGRNDHTISFVRNREASIPKSFMQLIFLFLCCGADKNSDWRRWSVIRFNQFCTNETQTNYINVSSPSYGKGKNQSYTNRKTLCNFLKSPFCTHFNHFMFEFHVLQCTKWTLSNKATTFRVQKLEFLLNWW